MPSHLRRHDNPGIRTSGPCPSTFTCWSILRPLPPFARITFTFDDGVAVNTVEYITADGDADSDNDHDLADFAALQNCYSAGETAPDCRIFDLTIDEAIDEADFAELSPLLSGP